MELYAKIKQNIEKVLKNPNVNDFKTLNNELAVIEDRILELLQDLTLHPLILLVDNVQGENRNEIKTALIECIATILKKIKIRKTVAFKTTVIILTQQIYDSRNNEVNHGLSEELKTTIIQALSASAINLPSDLVEEIYVKENVYLISQVIYVCVELLIKETYRKLKLEAIECILGMMQVHDDSDFNDIVLRNQISELLFIILPKLVATFATVINGDDKQGRKVIKTAVKALKRILCLIFEEYDRAATINEITSVEISNLVKDLEINPSKNVLGLNLKDGKIREEYFSNTARSKVWLLQADEKITTVFVGMTHLRGSYVFEVRLEYAEMCCELIEKCSENMKNSTPQLLESIIALSQDDNQEISTKCSELLKKLGTNVTFFLKYNFDELFYKNLIKMPKILYREEENEQISSLLLIKGYLMLFSCTQIKIILSNKELLKYLMSFLLVGAEIELSNNELLRKEFNLDRKVHKINWRISKNLRNERCEEKFLDIILIFQEKNAFNVISNYILDDLYSVKSNNNEYIYILSELISKKAEKSDLEPIIDEILKDYHWNLEVDQNEDICNQKYNILHICLVLTCVGQIAVVLKNDFKPYLYTVLHLALEKSGSNLNCIQQSAEKTLEKIAKSLKYLDIHDLIYNNLDYLSQFISKAIKKQRCFIEGIKVLQSVLKFVPYDSSTTLENTITPILMNIIESYKEKSNAKICLRVFQVFIFAIRNKFVTENKNKSVKSTDNVENLYEMWMDQLKDEDGISENNENPEDEEPIKEEIPPHIEISVKILTITSRYISSNDQSEKIISLETLESGIQILKDYENQLLPLVHKIWYNLSERFQDKDPIVLSRAFDLFVTMAKLAKDFIRKDSLTHVFPKINAFLKNSMSTGFGEIQTFKLQLKILRNYASLIIALQLHERELNTTLDIVKTYLLKNERRELREAAQEFFHQVECFDPTAVYVKLKQ